MRGFVELYLWTRLRADDRFLYRGSDQRNLRHKQHIELGGIRGDEYCHHAGDIHLHIGERFNEHESNGDDHLHADSNQCCGLDHFHANHYRKHGRQSWKQTDDHLLHRQPRGCRCGFEQHIELGDDRGDQSCHRSGSIHARIRKWFVEREPNCDDHLHANGDKCQWLDHVHRNSHANSARWSIDDSNHFLPKRNSRRGVSRLHNSCQRRLSPLHLFS